MQRASCSNDLILHHSAPLQGAHCTGVPFHQHHHARRSPIATRSTAGDGTVISRRETLLSGSVLAVGAASAGPALLAKPAQAALPTFSFLPGEQQTYAALHQQLFASTGAKVTNPGVAWAVGNAGKQLLHPAWLEGTWQVRAHFGGVMFPLGQRYMSKAVPGVLKASAIMALADVGAAMDRPVQYSVRFTNSSAEGGVVADRPFNIKQQVNALLGYDTVTSVSYAPEDNPTRLAIVYQTPRRDKSDIATDVRKAEVFINNRGHAGQEDADGTAHFIGWENYRQVNQAQRQGAVYDYLVANEYIWQPSNAGHVAVRQRVAAFLQPQDALYFDVGNQAVALYDYTYDWDTASDAAQQNLRQS